MPADAPLRVTINYLPQSTWRKSAASRLRCGRVAVCRPRATHGRAYGRKQFDFPELGTPVTHGDEVHARSTFVILPNITQTHSMPILGSQPDLFPEDLLDRPAPESGYSWSVAHTLPRREKDLMRRLHQGGIGFYGPTVPRRFRSPNGRKRVSFVPLFAGYVFTYTSEDQRLALYETNAICQILPVGDGPRLVSDLCQIRRLIATDAPLTPEARLEKGNLVRIRSGPMQGLEGIVVQRRGHSRLLVAVEFLKVGASVQLDDCELERIGN